MISDSHANSLKKSHIKTILNSFIIFHNHIKSNWLVRIGKNLFRCCSSLTVNPGFRMSGQLRLFGPIAVQRRIVIQGWMLDQRIFWKTTATYFSLQSARFGMTLFLNYLIWSFLVILLCKWLRETLNLATLRWINTQLFLENSHFNYCNFRLERLWASILLSFHR